MNNFFGEFFDARKWGNLSPELGKWFGQLQAVDLESIEPVIRAVLGFEEEPYVVWQVQSRAEKHVTREVLKSGIVIFTRYLENSHHKHYLFHSPFFQSHCRKVGHY